MNKTIITAVVVAIIFGGGGYYFGSSSAGSSTATQSTAGGYAGRTGAGAGRFGGGAGSGGTIGNIIAKDATSITVQLRAMGTTTGTTPTGTKIVLYDTNTQILKTDTGTANDLTVGQSVVVSGTTNSDGSVTATSIQLRPATAGRPAAMPPTGQ